MVLSAAYQTVGKQQGAEEEKKTYQFRCLGAEVQRGIPFARFSLTGLPVGAGVASVVTYFAMPLREQFAYIAGSLSWGRLDGPMQPTRYGCHLVPT